MGDERTPANRREFLGLAASTAAAGLGVGLPVAAVAADAAQPATDFTRWLDGIPGRHRQVYDMPELNAGYGLAWSYVFLLTGQQAYGCPESDLGVVLVLRHGAIPLAFGDSVWAKYKLGEYFKIEDPETHAPAVRNPYYDRPGQFPIPDIALHKLIDRGVHVGVCSVAIHFQSKFLAASHGLKHEDVERDWIDAVLPGITRVPSGVVACNGAQSRGCSYVFAG